MPSIIPAPSVGHGMSGSLVTREARGTKVAKRKGSGHAVRAVDSCWQCGTPPGRWARHGRPWLVADAIGLNQVDFLPAWRLSKAEEVDNPGIR